MALITTLVTTPLLSLIRAPSTPASVSDRRPVAPPPISASEP
jgi:hypothetical protein